MTVDSSGRRHIIITAFPSGGWSLSFDRVEGPGVFLTAVGPNPELVRTQALVEQRLDSTIPVSRVCRVYLRTASHGSPPGDYALVAQVPGR